jgi:hypothetical protein
VRPLLVLAWFAACRPAAPAASLGLRVAVSGRLDPVSPRPAGENWANSAAELVFEPLVVLGNTGELVPVLAARAELLPTRAVRVWLRTDASFSDGSRVTFEDVAHSLEGHHLRATQEGSRILIEPDDPATPVEVQLPTVYVHRAELGTGGFMLAEHDQSHIVLRRRLPSPGHIASVSFIAYKSPQEAFAHTLKGDADLLPDVDPRWLEFVEGVARLRVMRTPSPYANVVAFNVSRLSREERIGLVALLRSDEMRKLAFGDDCAAPEQGPAKRTAAPGGKAHLDVLAVPIFERFALAIRRSLGERGGAVRIQAQREFFNAIKTRDFDLVAARPRIWPPIMAMQSWRTGAPTNVLGYSDPLVDAALDAQNWAAAQRALDDDPPLAVICKPEAVIVMDSRIQNVPNSRFWASVAQWEVRE